MYEYNPAELQSGVNSRKSGGDCRGYEVTHMETQTGVRVVLVAGTGDEFEGGREEGG